MGCSQLDSLEHVALAERGAFRYNMAYYFGGTDNSTSRRGKPMPPTPPDTPHDAEQAEEARRFYERLEQAGQLVDVEANADTSALPPHVTHVRYPDGTVKRIRFTASPYRQG
jgi:hypothetical protein